MKIISKMFNRLQKKIFLKLDGINTKKYMNKYNKWLKKNGVDINGKIKYIHHTVYFDGAGFSKIHIGNNTVFSMNVILLCHDYSIEAGLTTISKNGIKEAYFLKDIYIGNNCFIGANTIILPGATIGDDCIIGSGSVLSGKSYPSNSVIVGNPARILCKTSEWAQKKYNDRNYME